MPSYISGADSDFLPPESGMVVDYHWIDLFQDDNMKSFDMTETVFFNNTGDEQFNGTVYLWIPSGAAVIANCCDRAPDMACRLTEEGAMSCHTVWQVEDDVVSLAPFSQSQLLSFFGQKAILNLSAVSQVNTTNSEYISITVDVGGSSVVAGDRNTSAARIHLISENSTLGAVQQFESTYPPLKYDYVQKLEIYNNGGESDVFDLRIEAIPEGWQASFVSSEANITSISVEPQEKLEIDLVIEVPSHLATTLLTYEIDLSSGEDERVTTTYSKRFLYDSADVEYYAFLLGDTTLEEGSNVKMLHPPPGEDPIWNEPNGRYWYIVSSKELIAGATATMTIGWIVETDYLPYVLLLAFLGLMIILIAVPVLRKRKLKSKGELASDSRQTGSPSKSEVEPAIPMESTAKAPDNAGLERAMDRVEGDYERGLITKEQAFLLTSRLRTRKSADPRQGKQVARASTQKGSEISEGAELSGYVAQLGTLKRIVKELDAQHEDGTLPDDIHTELRAEYAAKIGNIQSKMESPAPINSEHIVLNRKKEKILEAIVELRADYESGRLSKEVHDKLKESYEGKVTELDRTIEKAGRK
jgi:hypothetical protein